MDLTGKTFGRWTVLGKSDKRHSWEARCSCGTVRAVYHYGLIGGTSLSCGCRKRDAAYAKRPEFGVWWSMHQRCENPDSAAFANYGGRGIAVCERWREFRPFFQDMGTRPSADHSIERIDNEGNYEPSNCRWATSMDQSRNKRSNLVLTYGGETMVLMDWSQRTGIAFNTLRARVHAGWSPDAVIETPPGSIVHKPLPSSGARGVYIHPGRAKPYQAKIQVAGRSKSLGYFETLDAAAAAYRAATNS